MNEHGEWLRETLKGYREPSEADFRALDSLLAALEAAEADARQKDDKIRDAFMAVANLRGYTANLTDGCDASKGRGQHFTAHVEAIL